MISYSQQIVKKLWNYCNVLPACAKQGVAGRRDDLLARGAQANGNYPSAELRTCRAVDVSTVPQDGG